VVTTKRAKKKVVKSKEKEEGGAYAPPSSFFRGLFDLVALQSALKRAIQFVPAKTTIPTLYSFRFQSTGAGMVEITSTNLESGGRFVIPSLIDSGPDSALFPAHKLFELMNLAHGVELVELSGGENFSTVSHNKGHFELASSDGNSFPDFLRSLTGGTFSTTFGDLKKAITRTSWCTQGDYTKYASQGVLIDGGGGKVSLVATDLKRLSMSPLTTEGLENWRETVIPVDVLVRLSRLDAPHDAMIKVEATPNEILFKGPGFEVYSRLIAGQFPPWRDIRKQVKGKDWTFDRQELLSGVLQAAALCDADSRRTTLALSPSSLTVSAKSSGLGAGSSHCACEGSSDLSVDLDPAFVTEFLKSTRENQVILKGSTPDNPILFICGDHEYLVMPLFKD